LYEGISFVCCNRLHRVVSFYLYYGRSQLAQGIRTVQSSLLSNREK